VVVVVVGVVVVVVVGVVVVVVVGVVVVAVEAVVLVVVEEVVVDDEANRYGGKGWPAPVKAASNAPPGSPAFHFC
jgi:hypothetical protein